MREKDLGATASQSLAVDPVCLFHGKRWSEHHCLYCCLCFDTLTPKECYEDAQGVKWDMCRDCGAQNELDRQDAATAAATKKGSAEDGS